MGIGGTIKNEVRDWAGLGVIIVIVSIILLKFKDVSGVTASLNTTIDTFVTAFSEPKNWAIIVVIQRQHKVFLNESYNRCSLV